MERSNAALTSENETVQNWILDSSPFKQLIKSWGASLVGIGDVKEGLAEEFHHLPVALSLAIAHPSVSESIISKGPVTAYSNQFPQIDEKLERIQKRVVSYLRSKGWKAFDIPPDTGKKDNRFSARLFPLFPHKTAATCSGLGWIGKNGLLVTEEYGARLSWATVLTNAPLEVSSKPFLTGQCGNCRRCERVCPAKAIKGIEWSRENACESMIDIDKCGKQLVFHGQQLGKYICGHCIVACPLSKT